MTSSGYSGDDFYCDVALADISALDVVHDGAGVLAYHHTRPHWPVHVVVVPKTTSRRSPIWPARTRSS